jgi:uncharacterized protein (TIRG00374 family)
VARAAGVSLLLHAFNIAGLFTIFQMFGRPVGLATLVATFGLSTALYVVSVTPQGVGSVEGGTALVLEALGLPAQLAIAVTLTYRAMNIWVPVVLGFGAAELLVTRPPAVDDVRGVESTPERRDARSSVAARGDPVR